VIRVAVADDQSLFRTGFRVLLDGEDDLELVGEAGDGQAAVHLASRLRPDVFLMDIRMPGTDGIQATRAIATDPRLAGVRVLILTTYDLDAYVFEGLRAGASGFLVKDTEPVELLNGIRVVATGTRCCPPASPAASSPSSWPVLTTAPPHRRSSRCSPTVNVR
jgi:DNA-binding NarL/FixJ family response regulator